MKLTKQEINAITEKIFKEIIEAIRAKKNAELKTKEQWLVDFKKTSEYKKLEKVINAIKEYNKDRNKNKADNYYYDNSDTIIYNMYSAYCYKIESKYLITNNLKEDIKTDLIISQIGASSDINTLIEEIKAKYLA